MANLHGTGGAFTSAGFTGKIQQWSANFNPGVLDVTGFGDAGYKKAEASTMQCTGTATGILTDVAPVTTTFFGATFNKGAWSITITLTCATGKTFAFTGVISGMDISRLEVGDNPISFSFVSSGVITETWS